MTRMRKHQPAGVVCGIGAKKLGGRNYDPGPGVKKGLSKHDCYFVNRRERDQSIGLTVRARGSLNITE